MGTASSPDFGVFVLLPTVALENHRRALALVARPSCLGCSMRAERRARLPSSSLHRNSESRKILQILAHSTARHSLSETE